ncbi:hypothetical protein KSS87_007402 [Heliosperma pusillum]|nr:hypothetical protein KSS87_007402 [Heliosperma pusillum]
MYTLIITLIDKKKDNLLYIIAKSFRNFNFLFYIFTIS